MMTRKNEDGGLIHSPDIKETDAEIFAYWEERARICANPVMRARYADLVWDLKSTATRQRPDVKFATIAIDSYLDAIESHRYQMEMFGVEWLARTLQLARSIKDEDRAKGAVDSLFRFYDKIAEVGRAGTWIFLFDLLYGEKCITSEQEARIITQLEDMFARVTDLRPSESGTYRYDPFAAESAADRLLRHYHRLQDKTNVDRVTRALGGTFEHMTEKASPLIAALWLPKIVERYQQEGLKADAERAQLLAQGRGKNIASHMKVISVESGLTQQDVEKIAAKLVRSDDLQGSLIRIGSNFLPDVDGARELLEQMRTDAPLVSLMPVSFVDEAGNPAAAIGTVDDDEEGRLFQQLGRSLQFLQPILSCTLDILRETLNPSVD
ncbi:MAG TPA: hypothetical protein VIY69_06770, partial [Candidatus Acidoferrales bacterium]